MNKDIEVGKMYSTKEYGKFKIYKWNRDINKLTLNKIHKSVIENGWRVEPIIVNEEYGIIDGQHRFTYAKEHDLPIYYIVVKGLTEDDCQRMNSVRTSWLQADYIKFYATQGNQNYSNLMILDSIYTDVNLGILIYAICNRPAGGGSTKFIMSGDFICTKEDFDNATEVLDFLDNLMPYIKQIKGRKTQFCQGLIFCYRLEKTDKDRLARKIEENCNTINSIVDMETALQEIERVYNYRLSKENQIYFTTEWKQKK